MHGVGDFPDFGIAIDVGWGEEVLECLFSVVFGFGGAVETGLGQWGCKVGDVDDEPPE